MQPLKPKTPPSLFAVVALLFALTACGPEITFDEDARPLLESYNATTPQESLDAGHDTGSDDTGTADADASPGQPLTALDHAAWDTVVRNHVRGRCFAYDALDADPEFLSLTRVYIEQLGRLDLAQFSNDPKERLALWINAYNALTVFGVLRERRNNPNFSVLDNAFEFFNQRQFQVGDLIVSLNMIEHGIMRGREDHNSLDDLDDDVLARLREESQKLGALEPRLHMAINCASISCPNLRPEAYTGARLEEQLTAQTQEFLDDPFKGAGPDGISSLFWWFNDDFLLNGNTVESFIETYRTDGLNTVNTGTFLNYDWNPNAFETNVNFCLETL